MSRAFVDDDRLPPGGEDLPELPQSSNPGYITAWGLQQLRDQLDRLSLQELPPLQKIIEGQHAGATEAEVLAARVKQQIQYLQGRIARAIVVDPASAAPDRVHFGSIVTVCDHNGDETRYTIVGEDEDDPDLGRVTCFSPLAKALMTKRVGETAVWHRPIGDVQLTIVKIEREE